MKCRFFFIQIISLQKYICSKMKLFSHIFFAVLDIHRLDVVKSSGKTYIQHVILKNRQFLHLSQCKLHSKWTFDSENVHSDWISAFWLHKSMQCIDSFNIAKIKLSSRKLCFLFKNLKRNVISYSSITMFNYICTKHVNLLNF